MVCYRRHYKSSRPTDHKKNRRHISRSIVAIFQDEGQINCHNDTTHTSHHHVGILRSPALLPPPLFVEYALQPPTSRAKKNSRANLAHSVTALDSSTAVRHRPQHCRGGTYFCFRRCSCPVANLSSNAAQIASVKSPRAPTPSANDSHSVVRAVERSAPRVIFSSQESLIFFLFFQRRERAIPATSLRSWSEFSDGNRASSAVTLHRGIHLGLGVRAPNAAPIHHGTGAFILRDRPPGTCAATI